METKQTHHVYGKLYVCGRDTLTSVQQPDLQSVANV